MNCQHNALETHTVVYSEDEVGIFTMCKDCGKSYNHMYTGDDARSIAQHIKATPFTEDI